MVDLPTKDQADRQALAIESYWRGRGHEVAVWVERIRTDRASDGRFLYVVRSSLVDGLPPLMTPRRRLVPVTVE